MNARRIFEGDAACRDLNVGCLFVFIVTTTQGKDRSREYSIPACFRDSKTM
jgi:hypothetical protein